MEDITLTDDRTARHKTKDSVFTWLFRDVNNVFELYKELHPEDTAVTVDDIQLETLQTVLINDIYNDLGFIVNVNGNAKYVLLFEAQSRWTENLTLRILFYIAETYRRYLKETKQSEHNAKRINLPKPELYVLYTGDKGLPDEISFKDDYFDGDAPIDVRVKILRQSESNTIYGQYIGFSKVYDEQRKIYGNKLECIGETIRICLEKGYLTDFLNQHKQEVVTMLSDLFDEQAQREQYDIAVKKESEAIGEARGRAEGRTEGEARGKAELLKKLIELGNSVKQLSDMLGMSEIEIEGLLAANT
ncbi:MAG: Rpn family recombination-promoting nuclease/putative transposase [Clostridia bacterium]|nr:Rpn family recombination-promoting nuclease/putative transposase [Clostridia bacterium]